MQHDSIFRGFDPNATWAEIVLPKRDRFNRIVMIGGLCVDVFAMLGQEIRQRLRAEGHIRHMCPHAGAECDGAIRVSQISYVIGKLPFPRPVCRDHGFFRIYHLKQIAKCR